MRSPLPQRLEDGRVIRGPFRSSATDGAYGCFYVFGPCGEELKIIASEGDAPESHGWEHVSVSTQRRIPNWREMSFVKDLFWSDEECVVQFHPPKSEYVNQHPNCLHLWRNVSQPFPMPPSVLVGVKAEENPTPEEREYRALRAIFVLASKPENLDLIARIARAAIVTVEQPAPRIHEPDEEEG